MSLLGNGTLANAGLPYYSGGGGGGGVMSSIQLGTSFVACANDGSTDVIMNTNAGSIALNSGSTITVTGGGDIQIGNSNGAVGCILTVGLDGMITASESLSTAAFFCSSINGAAPGGSAGPNPTFSTVTTQLDATIGGSVTCGGITVNGANATTTTLSVNASNYLSVANGVNTGNLVVSSINGAAPGGAISTFAQLFTSSIGTTDPANVDLVIGGVGGTYVAFDMSAGNLNQLILSQQGNSAAMSFSSPGGNPTLTIGAPNGTPADIPVNISTLRVSTINGAAPGNAVGTPYNVAPWAGYASVAGGMGIFAASLNLGGTLAGGNFSSTIQLPAVLDYTNAALMSGNVISGSYGLGGLGTPSINFPNISTFEVSCSIAGSVSTLYLQVFGPAAGLL